MNPALKRRVRVHGALPAVGVTSAPYGGDRDVVSQVAARGQRSRGVVICRSVGCLSGDTGQPDPDVGCLNE